ELGIATRNTRVVAPGVKRSQRHRRIRIPEVENAVVTGMAGEKLAQFRDGELCGAEARPLHAREREYLGDRKRSQQKYGTRLAARPEREANRGPPGDARYQQSEPRERLA